MRGVAIMFIMLHNLLHWILPTVENEFTFSIDRSLLFVERFVGLNTQLILDIFSFLGWYGVAVFLFLSGYGLAKKYGLSTPLMTKQFVTKHFKSVFFLLLLPYLPFALLSIYQMNIKQVLLQVSLLANIFDPNGINPGVFWFFGLIMQFYLLFALLRMIKSQKVMLRVLMLLNVISLVGLVLLSDSPNVLNWVRHNFVGWLLPFSLGIWLGQSSKWGVLFNANWKNLLWVVCGGLLVMLSNLNYYFWIFGSVMAIFAAIGLAKLMSKVRCVDEIGVWLGSLSAFIFAVHPAIRLLCKKICFSDMTRFPYLMGYVLLSIIFAIIYRYIHKRLFSRWL